MLVLARSWRWPLAVLAVFLPTIYLLYSWRGESWFRVGSQGYSPPKETLLERQQAFWQLLHSEILENEPLCPPVAHVDTGDLLKIDYEQSGTAPDRPDRLNVSTTQLDELRSRHRAFTSTLRRARYPLPYISKTRGIVTTAGGKYLPVAVVSIRMLRETGCELPVEVFLATQDEWDAEICNNVLPGLNSRCVVLADIFDPVHRTTTLGIHKYQYKIMSVVFSSFEEVLFLDSDCFPIYDPTEHFTTEPFTQTGMILWPDFWYPSESPAFFDIAGIPLPTMNRQPATESGEAFYSKPKHTNSLLLAMYYNFYGPNFYYPLQSQGAPGEGDKETFLWSAVAFDEPCYSVPTPVKALGYMTTDGEWRGSAMVQFNAIQALRRQHQVDTNGDDYVELTTVQPLFVHANMPKIDPGGIFQDKSFGAVGPTKDADGTMRRIWHANEEEAVAFFGFDVERRMWNVVRDVACEFEGKFKAWEGLDDVCKQATDYWIAIFGANTNGTLPITGEAMPMASSMGV